MTTRRSPIRPLILLAAHGERGGAGDDARLGRLAREAAALTPEADVATALVSVEGDVAAVLAEAGERPVACLPLLFSDGFFHTQRLVPHFGRPDRRLAPPLALWPGFAGVLAEEAGRRLAGRHAAQTILAAHGSRRPGRSAAVARGLAGELAALVGPVEAAFLEEPPFAADVLARAAGPVALVGLFLGDGLHGGEDFARLAETPGVAVAFTAGEMETLAGFVAERARGELAALRRS
jgi:hypothetical protein